MDIYVFLFVSILEAIWIFMQESLFLFLLVKYLEVALMHHRVGVCLAIEKVTTVF